MYLALLLLEGKGSNGTLYVRLGVLAGLPLVFARHIK